MTALVVSADSHIVEPPEAYSKHIDPKYRDNLPHIVPDGKGGEGYLWDGIKRPLDLGLMSAAGIPKEIMPKEGPNRKFADLHRSGWDSSTRVADQDKDGVDAEIIYASVGMVLCNAKDPLYKDALFRSYNRWLETYCGGAPDRIFGLGQTAILDVDSAIEDFRRIKEQGFVGVMMPGQPIQEDYDHVMYDALWECAIDLELPICFHILTSKESAASISQFRGHRLNGFMKLIRAIQDLIGLFTLGGVFERNPKLRFVGAEGDAGWLPHYMARMDHAVERHGYGKHGRLLPRMPSEYIRENVWLTFQDDWEAFGCSNRMNSDRLLWANDFPHSDSTWPDSMPMLDKHAECVTQEVKDKILGLNCIDLFNLPTKAIAAAKTA
ncbi:MAG: amidohydrolase [Porticoccaceae bacterium]|nr:amidohydrolase [Porticoccaceae bacterium]